MNCIKCGGNEQPNSGYSLQMGLAWAGKGHSKRYCTGQLIDCWLTARDTSRMPEHLDRKCNDCGYTWAEPCKDAKP